MRSHVLTPKWSKHDSIIGVRYFHSCSKGVGSVNLEERSQRAPIGISGMHGIRVTLSFDTIRIVYVVKKNSSLTYVGKKPIASARAYPQIPFSSADCQSNEQEWKYLTPNIESCFDLL